MSISTSPVTIQRYGSGRRTPASECWRRRRRRRELGAETRRPEAKHGRRTLVMERLREAEVTSAHAKARLHMFWAWTPDATPGELCVVYATTQIATKRTVAVFASSPTTSRTLQTRSASRPTWSPG